MTDGFAIADMVSVVSVIVAAILTILVYRWTRRDKRDEEIEVMKNVIEKLESRQDALEERSKEFKDAHEKSDKEMSIGLEELKTIIHNLRTSGERVGSEQRTLISKLDEVALKLAKVSDRLEESRETLREVEIIAKEARSYSHDHPVIGGRKV